MSDNRQLAPASGRRPTMIKGLVPSLPERGKIKIGVKGKMVTSQRGRQFQPPQKLDHFVVTTLQRGQDGNFIPDHALMERFGDHPTEIPVRLLYDDPVLNFPTRYACFIGRTLWCSGDGEVATRLTETPKQTADGVKPEPHEVQCPCFRQDPAYQGQDRCKMNGNLSVLIDGAGGIGGVWKWRTTSYNSIVGVMSSMAFLRSVTGGVLANIPLKLRLQPKQATAPHDGSQVLIYIVTLEFDGNIEGLQTIAHDIALTRAKTQVSIDHIEDEAKRLLALMPPSNAVLPGDITDDVVEEFYPEQADEAWPQSPRQPTEPEPSREVINQEPETVYAVIDADGEEHEYTTAAGAAKAIGLVFKDAAKRGAAHLQGAVESNTHTLQALRQDGHGALVDALAAEFHEMQKQADPFGLPPTTTDAPDGEEHAENAAAVAEPETGAGSEPSGAPAAAEPAPPKDLLGGKPSENLIVPMPRNPGPADFDYYARQMLAMIAEKPGNRQRMARIKIDNQHGIQKLKDGDVARYDEVMAAFVTEGKA